MRKHHPFSLVPLAIGLVVGANLVPRSSGQTAFFTAAPGVQDDADSTSGVAESIERYDRATSACRNQYLQVVIAALEKIRNTLAGHSLRGLRLGELERANLSAGLKQSADFRISRLRDPESSPSIEEISAIAMITMPAQSASATVRRALSVFEQTVSSAEGSAIESIVDALEVHLTEIELALIQVMSRGDLKSANSIKELKNKVESLFTYLSDPVSWRVIFRSDDPEIWNTDCDAGSDRFAIALSRIQGFVKYIKLKRTDTGESVIVPTTSTRLGKVNDGQYFWSGRAVRYQNTIRFGVANRAWLHGYKEGSQVSPKSGHKNGYGGWGFGRVCLVNSGGQVYLWEDHGIDRTAFEVSIKFHPLPPEERVRLLGDATYPTDR